MIPATHTTKMEAYMRASFPVVFDFVIEVVTTNHPIISHHRHLVVAVSIGQWPGFAALACCPKRNASQ
jgi:hypothetical protein